MSRGTDNILIRGRPNVDRGLRFAESSSIMRVGIDDAQPVGDNGDVNRIGEIYLHTDVYKYRPDVNAVIHAHPPGVLLCTMNQVKLRPIFSGYEPGAMRIALYDEAPVFDRSITLHTAEETSPFLDLMANHNMCLMTGHGIVVTGKSVEEATSRALDAGAPGADQLAGPPRRRRARHLRRRQGRVASAGPRGTERRRRRRLGWPARNARARRLQGRLDRTGLQLRLTAGGEGSVPGAAVSKSEVRPSSEGVGSQWQQGL